MLDAAMDAAPDDPALPAYLAGLNEAQRRAVLHGEGGIAGPLLVIAGAGTGKTGTLAHRVAHLLVAGADPRRIMLLTFSRRAAAEMTRRSAPRPGRRAPPRRCSGPAGSSRPRRGARRSAA